MVQVNGQLKLWVHTVEGPNQSQMSMESDEDTASARAAAAPEFMGKVELKSFRVNQLQLAKSLEGSFNLRDNRFEMTASGSRCLPLLYYLFVGYRTIFISLSE